jgi:hypothetical protein
LPRPELERDPLNDQYPPLAELEAAIGPASRQMLRTDARLAG